MIFSWQFSFWSSLPRLGPDWHPGLRWVHPEKRRISSEWYQTSQAAAGISSLPDLQYQTEQCWNILITDQSFLPGNGNWRTACRMSLWSRGDLLLEIFLGHMKGFARWEAICNCWTIWTSWSSLEICIIVLDIYRTIFCWNSLKYCSVNSDMAKSQVTFSFGFRLDRDDNWVSFLDIFSSPLIISASV